MKNTFEGWIDVDKLKLDEVVNLILTGNTALSATPDEWLYNYIGENTTPITLLDFGCGVGRNSFGIALSRPNWQIIGYDSIQMISRIPEYCSIRYKGIIPPNLKFISDWEEVKKYNFDVILSILVLQHIYENYLSMYLSDFKKITKQLIVSGRRFNDDMVDGKYKNTWKILEKNGFTPYKCLSEYKVEGPEEEHITCFYKT